MPKPLPSSRNSASRVRMGRALGLYPPFYFARLPRGGFLVHLWRFWIMRDER